MHNKSTSTLGLTLHARRRTRTASPCSRSDDRSWRRASLERVSKEIKQGIDVVSATPNPAVPLRPPVRIRLNRQAELYGGGRGNIAEPCTALFIFEPENTVAPELNAAYSERLAACC